MRMKDLTKNNKLMKQKKRKTNENKSWLHEKMNRIIKPLVRLAKQNRILESLESRMKEETLLSNVQM